MTIALVIVKPVLVGLMIAFLVVMRRHRTITREIKPTPEPDPITRLAALADPDSAAAEMVRNWEAWVDYRDTMLRVVARSATLMQEQMHRIHGS